ncbi:MAG: ribosomal RNA small subunit methyltransferase A [Anaerolineales bacterium]|nr:ribosomal RNA small subunit methyltransferase A [Anaerolineales bacterium]
MLQPPNIPDLLQRYGLRPDKRLGQNFLIDNHALQRVAEAAHILPGDRVLEIGAGLGSLTVLLAARARQVTAVELDGDLIPPLMEALTGCDNVRIVRGDIMALDPAELTEGEDYLVVANIPYYITSALIRHLLEARKPPQRLVLTVQREVAERICAAPGEMSLLALSVQVYGQPQIVGIIQAGAFYPSPKVDSAIIHVNLYEQPLIPMKLLDRFFRLIKAGFSQKRKTLRNALAGGLGMKPQAVEVLLARAGIDAMRRAETLSIEEWGKILSKEDHEDAG